MASTMEFQRRPSVMAYMLRALLPSSGLSRAGGLPRIRAVWRRHRVDPRHLAEVLELTGLRAGEDLPMLVPHVVGFPLQMVILTHRAFPLPIWRALQIRNHLLQHRAIRRDAEVEIETRLASLRVLDKGAEVDLHTTVRSGDHLAWESSIASSVGDTGRPIRCRSRPRSRRARARLPSTDHLGSPGPQLGA